MKKPGLSLILAGLLAVGGCGGDTAGGADAGGDGDGDGDGDAGNAEWQTLLQGDWNLAALDEGYFCVYATIQQDTYIKAFRPLIPVGTHHTVLTIYDGGSSPADGTYPCDAGTNGQNMIYGSGVGSPDFYFPDGVGLHLAAGTRLLLNLHLYNSSETPLNGTSGSLYIPGSAADVQNEAEIVLAGPTFSLAVPTGVTTQSGDCHLDINETVHVFAMSQHMHKLGRHEKSVITRGSDQIVLQDINYDFENQTFQYTVPEVALEPGDVLTTYCTFENTPESHPPSGAPVTFGDSSDDEMCFTDLFYYPAQGASFICTF